MVLIARSRVASALARIIAGGPLLVWDELFFVDSFNVFLVALTAFVARLQEDAALRAEAAAAASRLEAARELYRQALNTAAEAKPDYKDAVTLLLPAMAPLLREDGKMVILVKPQFEAGRNDVGKGGIVRDPAVQLAACDKVRTCVEALGFTTEITDSPILGAEGNKEFLLYAQRPH